MEFDMKSKVYIKTDTDGRIVSCDGGYTTPTNLTDWIEIDKGTGDKYNLCQTHYFEAGLYANDGIPRYEYANGVCSLRSNSEIEADRAAIPAPGPSQLDSVEAQSTYTAMMTETLLEG